MAGVITLLTDFGYMDYFVPSMKGIILSINPSATIVDITHGVPSFNIMRGAFILYAAYKYFPRGTVHVAVVDPGVGTKRRPIVVRTRRYFFVGPDNGVLMMAADDDGVVDIYTIENTKYMRNFVSSTFHGRDIFAPVAAYLTLGVDPSLLGPRVTDPVRINVKGPRVSAGYAEASVIYVDHFGNAFTNMTVDHVRIMGIELGDELLVKLPTRGAELRVRFVKSYGYVNPNEPLALINSEGYLELGVNMGNFAEKYGVIEGDEVVLEKS